MHAGGMTKDMHNASNTVQIIGALGAKPITGNGHGTFYVCFSRAESLNGKVTGQSANAANTRWRGYNGWGANPAHYWRTAVRANAVLFKEHLTAM